MNQYRQVREFHRVFGHPVADEETNIPAERVAQRFAIMSEEVREYEAAIKAGDLVEVADALADLAYTVFGTLVEHGLSTYDLQTRDVPPSPRLLPPEVLQASIQALDEELQAYVEFATVGDVSEASFHLFQLLARVEILFEMHNIVPGPIFEIVHASNMSKLGEDGKPVPHPTVPGKSGKGPNFWEPQEMIRNELKVQGWEK